MLAMRAEARADREAFEKHIIRRPRSRASSPASSSRCAPPAGSAHPPGCRPLYRTVCEPARTQSGRPKASSAADCPRTSPAALPGRPGRRGTASREALCTPHGLRRTFVSTALNHRPEDAKCEAAKLVHVPYQGAAQGQRAGPGGSRHGVPALPKGAGRRPPDPARTHTPATAPREASSHQCRSGSHREAHPRLTPGGAH